MAGHTRNHVGNAHIYKRGGKGGVNTFVYDALAAAHFTGLERRHLREHRCGNCGWSGACTYTTGPTVCGKFDIRVPRNETCDLWKSRAMNPDTIIDASRYTVRSKGGS